MSINETALRKITFPHTPDTFQSVTTPVNYLVYRLPYTTSILLYNDVTNPLVTRTFKPDERFVEDEILDADPTSPNYNKPVIEDYIRQDIFSRLPLSYTTTTGVAGTPIDPAILNIVTVGTILQSRWAPGGAYEHIDSSSFMRDGKVCWLSRSSSNGDGEFPSLIEYDIINNTTNFTDVVTDSGFPDSAHTNPVYDSTGIPYVILYPDNVGNPGNLDFRLATLNNSTGNLDFRAAQTSVLAVNQPYSGVANLVIDGFDNLYLCLFTGIWKYDMVNDTFDLLFAAPNGTDFRQIEYNIIYNTLHIKTSADTIIECDLTGTVINDPQNLNGQFPSDFSTGAVDQLPIEALLFPQDGPIQFTVGNYLGDTNFYNTLMSNFVNYIIGFTDGDLVTGEISQVQMLVGKYDTRDSDIYFIDILDFPGV